MHCSEEEGLQDAGMADLQKSLERVVQGKREHARQEQLAMFKVGLYSSKAAGFVCKYIIEKQNLQIG